MASNGLVLTRKIGQEIIVDSVRFKIVAIKGKQVRVAIVAPRHLSILRSELVEGTKKEKAA